MGGQKTFFCGVLFALGYVGLKFVQSAEGRSSHGEDIFRNICQQIIFVINTKICLCHVIKPQLYWRQIPETCQLVQDLHSFYQNLLCGTRPKSPLRCFAPGLYIFPPLPNNTTLFIISQTNRNFSSACDTSNAHALSMITLYWTSYC